MSINAPKGPTPTVPVESETRGRLETQNEVAAPRLSVTDVRNLSDERVGYLLRQREHAVSHCWNLVYAERVSTRYLGELLEQGLTTDDPRVQAGAKLVDALTNDILREEAKLRSLRDQLIHIDNLRLAKAGFKFVKELP